MKNGPYILIQAPADYRGKKYRGRYAYEHHIVWWEKTGQLITSGYLLHHKNGDKQNNRLENLELLSIAKHNKQHSRGRKMCHLTCAWCGKSIVREQRKINPDQVNFFCSISHASKYQFNT